MSLTVQPQIQAMPGIGEIWQGLRAPIVVLAVGLAVLGVTFSAEAMAAYRVWMDSTAYSHCLFVLPIALYLAWERRAEIMAAPVVPVRWVTVLALPAGLAWLVAERLGIMEGRQLMVVSLVELLFLAVLGWRMAIALSAPLLYLYFLVPFGAFITPLLQEWTAIFTGIGLRVLDIPHEMDGYLIDVPGGRFFIAEACAGLRFLIASIAFGVLYACLMYQSPWRRAGFIVASIVVPIVANWFRALGIVVLGYVLGSAEAAAADHIIYGWVFFSAVTLLLILVGLPFRQDGVTAVPARSVAAVPPVGRLAPSAVLAVGLGLVGPLVAAGFDRAGGYVAAAPQFAWTTPVGCVATPAVMGEQPGSEIVQFNCAQTALVVTAQVFSPRATWSQIGAARVRLSNEQRAEEVSTGSLTMPAWTYVVAAGTPSGSFMTASALWIAGEPAKGGLGMRMQLARQSIMGTGSPSLLLSVGVRTPRATLRSDEERQIRQMLNTFVQGQYSLVREVARLTQAQ